MKAVHVGLLCATLPLFLRCSSHRHAPFASEPEEPQDDSGILIAKRDASSAPPAADAQGYCGNLVLPATVDRPNLYFVLDRSGSMGEAFGTSNKFDIMHAEVVDVVRKLGAQVNVGAAMFPGLSTQSAMFAGVSALDYCKVGGEVFPTQRGDVVSSSAFPGVVTNAFYRATNLGPSGGTPTAATLLALFPTLAQLAGRTYVILATDGAPNCNQHAACDEAHCLDNLAQGPCDPVANCCSPTGVSGPMGPLGCIDENASVEAISALKRVGIPTYVIGLPDGTAGVAHDAFAHVLDQLATAGGTARSSAPLYYAASGINDLENAIVQIGARVLLTCHLVLEREPPSKDEVNVYLDERKILFDPAEGWTWTSSTELELRGSACATLQSGQVGQVQVVAGCPTERPR